MEQARRLTAIERRLDAIERARIEDREAIMNALIEYAAVIAQLKGEVTRVRASRERVR